MQALNARQEKLLTLFKSAVESEREAQETYRRMLFFSDDPTIRLIIEEFIGEEMRHEDKLIEMYNDLRNTKEFKKPV